jgi:RNA 3'-terminal phosphate cyclase (ATP)
MITIDGQSGEGGGQILRSSLTLSLLTGKPFRVTQIRTRRKTPGLMRQHLTSVLAAAEVGQATVEGAAVGSTELLFQPGEIRGGDYTFSVGTAGSTVLVLQTILPALWSAPGPSTVSVEGGTHCIKAPTFDFLERTFVPIVNRMGASIQVTLERNGFYPAGGGKIRAEIQPGSPLGRLDLRERGELRPAFATALVSGLPYHVADRELSVLAAGLSWPREGMRPTVDRGSRGPGNVLMAYLESDGLTEVFSSVGERGKPAEEVASLLIAEIQAYLAHGAPVGEHLADQLLLPMAMGAGGVFRTGPLSLHATTQIETIRRFLEVPIEAAEVTPGVWEVRVK